MGRGRLTQEEIDSLKQNPFVSDVGETRIIYTNEFKHLFMTEYLEGKKPTQIFRDAGFDTKALGSKRIERAAQRWKESYAAGTLGVYQNGTLRKSLELEMSDEEEYKIYNMYLKIMESQREKIKKLQEENERLKKKLENQVRKSIEDEYV